MGIKLSDADNVFENAREAWVAVLLNNSFTYPKPSKIKRIWRILNKKITITLED